MNSLDARTTPEAPHGEPVVVAGMFKRIAPRYDLMNRLLSFGQDSLWRRFAANAAQLKPGDAALDICCGTGDLSFALMKRVGSDGHVVGLDITRDMLLLGREKVVRRKQRRIDLHEGDAMQLPYASDTFHAATMAFGGRNVPDLVGAFREMARVVRPSGRIVFLELNRPRLWGFRQVFDWYFHTFSPLIGGLVSGDRAAYEYLPRSVDKFEAVEDIALLMQRAGLNSIDVHRLSFGVAVVHIGVVGG